MTDILGAEVDAEGFLVNLSDWTQDIAIAMAKDDDIQLTEEHWNVINFLRDYFEEYQIVPAMRVLTKAMGKRFGQQQGSSQHLYALFPCGPNKQGCRFAGLPKPNSCI